MDYSRLFERPEPKSQCRFRAQFETLETKDQELVLTALDDLSIPISWIVEVLTENGFRVSDSTLRTHRKNMCVSCQRAR